MTPSEHPSDIDLRDDDKFSDAIANARQSLESLRALSESHLKLFQRNESVARHHQALYLGDTTAARIGGLFNPICVVEDENGESDPNIRWIDVVQQGPLLPLRQENGFFYLKLNGRKGLIKAPEMDYDLLQSGLPWKLINPTSYRIDIRIEKKTTELIHKEISELNALAMNYVKINDEILKMASDRIAALTELPMTESHTAATSNETDPPGPPQATSSPKNVEWMRVYSKSKKVSLNVRAWTAEELDTMRDWYPKNKRLSDGELEAQFEKDFGYPRTPAAIRTAWYRNRAKKRSPVTRNTTRAGHSIAISASPEVSESAQAPWTRVSFMNVIQPDVNAICLSTITSLESGIVSPDSLDNIEQHTTLHRDDSGKIPNGDDTQASNCDQPQPNGAGVGMDGASPALTSSAEDRSRHIVTPSEVDPTGSRLPSPTPATTTQQKKQSISSGINEDPPSASRITTLTPSDTQRSEMVVIEPAVIPDEWIVSPPERDLPSWSGAVVHEYHTSDEGRPTDALDHSEKPANAETMTSSTLTSHRDPDASASPVDRGHCSAGNHTAHNTPLESSHPSAWQSVNSQSSHVAALPSGSIDDASHHPPAPNPSDPEQRPHMTGTKKRKRGTKSCCYTCSQKRNKCDGERPICGTCARYGHTCQGYPDPSTQPVKALRFLDTVPQAATNDSSSIPGQQNVSTSSCDTTSASPHGQWLSVPRSPFPSDSRLGLNHQGRANDPALPPPVHGPRGLMIPSIHDLLGTPHLSSSPFFRIRGESQE